jgi:hypothetical protein
MGTAIRPVMSGSAIFFQAAVTADAIWRAGRLDGGR